MIINLRNITHTNHPHASTYLCPQKLMLLPLTRPKYVMRKIQNRNFGHPMKSHSMHIIDPIFFFWGEKGGGGGFFGFLLFPMCSHQVHNGCSSNSWVPQVPKVFLNMFMIHFNLFHMLCPTLSPWSLYRWGDIGTYLFFCFKWIPRLGSLQSFRVFFWWAIQRGSWQKEKKNLNLEGTPKLINLNHTISLIATNCLTQACTK
jgi:hypothetical protein